MALMKPHLEIAFPSAKRLKIESSSRYTCLEDFPNELFFEIFQYLDVHHTYQGFHNLNIRLHSLLHDSTFPWKINISLISKSNFEQFNRQLLIPNRKRIQTLKISNPVFANSIFSPVKTAAEFSRLEALIFDGVRPIYLTNILRYLTSLENLSTFIILSNTDLEDILEPIFRLPKLKYLKIKLISPLYDRQISFDTTLISSINRIVLDGYVLFNAFVLLPSYLPYLQTLYIHSLGTSRHEGPLENINIKKWNHLKKVRIDNVNISFDKFEFISKQTFNEIESLHLSTFYDTLSYLNARRWKQLILSSMPKLRIFDIQFRDLLDTQNDDNSHALYKTILDNFSSSFWTERKWFFDYLFYQELFGRRVMFYSINSKRREYVFYKNLSRFAETTEHVEYIKILDENTMSTCKQYFPGANELLLTIDLAKFAKPLPNILENLMPVKQLTKLTITRQCKLSIEQFLLLLNVMPNMQTLSLSLNWFHINLADIQQSEIFRNITESNKISHLGVEIPNNLEVLKFFVALCRRVQHLIIETLRRREYEEYIRYFISNREQIVPNLCFLHLSNVYTSANRCLAAIVKKLNVSDKLRCKTVGTHLYICF